MNLTRGKREAVVVLSTRHLGKKWSKNFNCLTFVREVYREVGVEIPLVYSHTLPPKDFSISVDNLNSWYEGDILFLKRRGYAGERTWTHVGITLPGEKLIHCSEYFGGQVTITPKEEIFSFYHYVLSG